MSDDDVPELEGVIDRALDRADASAERDVAEHVPPPFVAVVARARRIDPNAVPAEALARADQAGPRRAPGRPAVLDEARLIAPFVEQARVDAELDIERRADAGVPPWQRRVDPVRVRAWTMIAGVMAAAAATILALGLVDGWRATRSDDARGRTQSLAGVDTSPDVHEATQSDAAAHEPASAPRRRASTNASAPEPTPEPLASEPAVLPIVPTPPVVSSPPPSSDGSRAASAKVPRDGLRQLDARAQAALAAGDRELADRLYAQIIARGGGQPLAEIAYGERFSLARARGVAQQRTLWRAYLEVFPRGRYADDADAGLCRTAAAADKTRCWSAYVARFPTGAYRDHADRWVGDTGADEP